VITTKTLDHLCISIQVSPWIISRTLPYLMPIYTSIYWGLCKTLNPFRHGLAQHAHGRVQEDGRQLPPRCIHVVCAVLQCGCYCIRFYMHITVQWSKSRRTAIPHFNHARNIWNSTPNSCVGSQYLNMQTQILAYGLNITILGIKHSTQLNVKPPNANIQTEQWVVQF
jgi:hypothetical protein